MYIDITYTQLLPTSYYIYFGICIIAQCMNTIVIEDLHKQKKHQNTEVVNYDCRPNVMQSGVNFDTHEYK